MRHALPRSTTSPRGIFVFRPQSDRDVPLRCLHGMKVFLPVSSMPWDPEPQTGAMGDSQRLTQAIELRGGAIRGRG